MIIKLLFTFTLLTQVLLAQNFGSMRFTNYADDRKGAFSLTFDDGLLTHTENAAPILNQYGFKGTFYVIPPYLSETLPGIWRYGTWPDFQLLANQGHEIGSHTMRHYDLTSLQWGSIDDDSTLLYELYQSKIFIEQKVPSEKCISLNYPYTLHNPFVDSAASLFYENARTLGQVANDSSLSENEWYGLKAKVVEFDLPRNSVDDDLEELFTFLEWTQNSISNHQWGMIIIHDVIPFSDLDSLINDIYEPVTNEWLTSLCDFLWTRSSTKDVWVETVGNITRYIKERDAASYQIISSSNQLIEINVTDDLNDEIYDYPLSAYVKIPDSWNYVRSEQNGIVDTLITTLSDSGKLVLVNVIPDNGVLKLSLVTSTDVENEIIFLSEFKLYQNYPNPFNPSTVISYQLPVGSNVTLKVFDILGNEVAVLINEYMQAGTYNEYFTIYNKLLSSGLYFYQLKAGDYSETKKMLFLK
ncbi:MAG: polysaccharide deacetylase family protein [Ignavibacteriaceae bacterium]